MIALLPIKQNSERIPGKTFKEINGKPLFYYVLKSLIDSNKISRIIINTDSNKLTKSINENYFNKKIYIVDRPKHLLGDFVPMNEIINHDISIFNEENYIQTHITNPLLKTSTIDAAIDLFNNKNFSNDSIVSINEHRNRFYDFQKTPINHLGESAIERTQDLKPIYEENSCFYIFSKQSFMKSNMNRIGNNPFYYRLNKLESIDIDYEEDFTIAKALMHFYELKK